MMEDNKNTTVETGADTTVEATVDTNDTVAGEETVTLSKADYDKAIQSAEDKIRTKYSKDIKKLQDKVQELSPAHKTETEIQLETRLAELETMQNEIARKEQYLNLQTTLQAHDLDKSLADYLRSEADIEAVKTIFNNMIALKGYVPKAHENNKSVSKDEWKKMSYAERAELFSTNPDLANLYMSK